jgi:hypothetical protein
MAKVTMTTTVNTQTGAPINTFTIGNTDTIKAVVLRTKMCAGAYMDTQEALSLTVANGSQTTATIPGSDPTPIAGRGATMTVESSTVTAATFIEGIDFTLNGKTITFTTAYTGTGKTTTITYDYYDTDAANLVYDVPVYPSNTKGTITIDGLKLVVWNEGILAQEVKSWATSGTANGVVQALITDA